MCGNSPRVVVVGDFFPSKRNEKLFINNNNEFIDVALLKIIQDAKFSFCNLEGTLTRTCVKTEKLGPNIKASPDCIRAYKTVGFTHLATANNHVNDFGQQGYLDTINSIKSQGLTFIGSGVNSTSINHYVVLSVDGKNILFYNVAETMWNAPTNSLAGVFLYDEYVVCNELRELKTKSRIDYIVVLYHGGIEYFPYPSPELKKRFHRMADSGADVILAQHSHCVGCEEWYNGSYLLYGQGNFLFDRQDLECCKSGLLLELSFGNNINVKKTFTKVENGCVKKDEDQFHSGFVERCSHVDDEEFLIEQLKDFVITQKPIKTRQFEKKTKVSKILKRVLPFALYSRYDKKYVQANFTYDQLLRIQYTVMSEQQRETAYYLVLKEKENERQNKK